MEPVNQKYWIEKEKEAAALVASFFSLEYIESRNKFSFLDGGFAKGGELIAMVEIKVTDYTPRHFHRSRPHHRRARPCLRPNFPPVRVQDRGRTQDLPASACRHHSRPIHPPIPPPVLLAYSHLHRAVFVFV